MNGAENEAGKFKPNLEVMLPTPHTGLVPGLVSGKWLLGAAWLPGTWSLANWAVSLAQPHRRQAPEAEAHPQPRSECCRRALGTAAPGPWVAVQSLSHEKNSESSRRSRQTDRAFQAGNDTGVSRKGQVLGRAPSLLEDASQALGGVTGICPAPALGSGAH